MAQVITEVTGGKKVWPQRGWDYLKHLEQSRHVSRPQYRNGNPEAQDAPQKTPEAQSQTRAGS